jgi:hypothetical protein
MIEIVWEDINQDYRSFVARRHQERSAKRNRREAARSFMVTVATAALLVCIILLPIAYSL